MISAAVADGGGGIAAQFVRSQLYWLRAFGYCRERALPGSLRARAHYVYRLFSLLFTVTYTSLEFIYVYQVGSGGTRVDDMLAVLFLPLAHLVGAVRLLAVFHWGAASLDRLLDTLNDPLLNPSEEASRARLAAGGRRSRLAHVLYAGVCPGMAAVWALLATARYARGLPAPLPFWCPLPPRPGPLLFAALQLVQVYAVTALGVLNLSMDALYCGLLYHCTVQCAVLRSNLESLIERAAERQRVAGGESDQIAIDMFADCVRHQELIYEMDEHMQRVFATPQLSYITPCFVMISLLAYKLARMHERGVELASLCMFLAATLSGLAGVCYCGDALSVESSRVAEAIYASSWHLAGVRLRRALLLAMLRAQRPLQPAAGGLVPFSLDTLVSVVKSSYSFYTLLRETQ